MGEHIFGPNNPISRVLAQKSVFVRPPKGYVEPAKTVLIPHHVKLPLLEYLHRAHGISTETIYNDLHGFIRSRSIHREAVEYLNEALADRGNSDDDSVVSSCSKAIDLNPLMRIAFRIRGDAYARQTKYELAIQDYSRLIELDPDDPYGHLARGAARIRASWLHDAVADLTKAADLDPDDHYAYLYRAEAYLERV